MDISMTPTVLNPSKAPSLGGLSRSSSAMSSTASFFSANDDQDINDKRSGSPDDMDVDDDEPDGILNQLNGMFRLIDLVGEQGSGGIVDKVVIDQESFSRLINTISPGAYASLTKISFSSLDKFLLRPIGVYGSRSEIVKLLHSLGAVDEPLLEVLAKGTGCGLTSGLYALIPPNMEKEEMSLHIIFWPEDMTWNDDAPSSVVKNRITFMHYLTKLCDQVICLISQEHAEKLVWDASDTVAADRDENSDRLFSFEVSKTNEQEEGVTFKVGFELSQPDMRAINTLPVRFPRSLSDLQPLLIAGEMKQAYLTSKYKDGRTVSRSWPQRMPAMQLAQKMREAQSIHLSDDLSNTELEILRDYGLMTRCPHAFTAWNERNLRNQLAREADMKARQKEGEANLIAQDSAKFQTIFLHFGIAKAVEYFQNAKKSDLLFTDDVPEIPQKEKDTVDQLSEMYPKIQESLSHDLTQFKTSPLGFDDQFKTLKKRFMIVNAMIRAHPEAPAEDKERAADLIFTTKDLRGLERTLSKPDNSSHGFAAITSTYFKAAASVVRMIGVPDSGSLYRNAEIEAQKTSEDEFIGKLPSLQIEEPVLAVAAAQIEDNFFRKLRERVHSLASRWAQMVAKVEHDAFEQHLRLEKTALENKDQLSSRTDLVEDLRKDLAQNSSLCGSVTIDSIKRTQGWSRSDELTVKGSEMFEIPTTMEYVVQVIDLSQEDRHNLRIDSAYIPKPIVRGNSRLSFELPPSHVIRHIQLLESDHLLLVVDDGESMKVYLDRMVAISEAVNREPKKKMNLLKLAANPVIAYDEAKRMLIVVSVPGKQVFLDAFVFDPNTLSLASRGSRINLTRWYDAIPVFQTGCFVSGKEEIFLLEDTGRGRVFSMITEQFRPAHVQLSEPPRKVFSTPDGSCLLLWGQNGVHVIHWATFGSNRGTLLDIPFIDSSSFSVTSLERRNIVYILTLEPSRATCRSVALSITSQSTEFIFRAQSSNGDGMDVALEQKTFHNCLIDCHADIWTRFPVVPAVERNILSTSGRSNPILAFVAPRDHRQYAPYFHELVTTFIYKTRKTTGGKLDDIKIHTSNMDSILRQPASTWVSAFRAGAFLLEIFCLIPIHIAVTRENRFVPLKDGVLRADFERQLLGASVGQIVDNLSFGWYESVFQSYMSNKPVKVVSSLGEQSVGKSFMLNHLVDTSFAGSAMRTTEGCWMSLTPTAEALIVSLDFEGVHSIERSAQEDMLLVLFNTAISNLVLFRNNFALSRDIMGMFQSFQSSSAVLDPAANPELFQSKLAVIIKDVVDNDAAEIAREFQLKFRRLVEEEQDSNFLTRLHHGQVTIIPWPVIESKKFYASFSLLQNMLRNQRITHPTAGMFLHSLKTLMAKLKTNDWGALDQNLASHRAEVLLKILPIALACGLAETEPDKEPLKNLDSDELIANDDCLVAFHVSALGNGICERDARLAELRQVWTSRSPRQSMSETEWVMGLSTFVDALVDARVKHVIAWIDSNVARFKDHGDIFNLRRHADTAIVELKLHVQFCKVQCDDCRLQCVEGRTHNGKHSCSTNHVCSFPCDFTEEHSEGSVGCTLPAGHDGKHICDVAAHLCGELCMLLEKKGCLQRCTQPVHHGTEHMCSARNHACGQPCDLMSVRPPEDESYSCSATCGLPWDEKHERHTCNAVTCPLTCQLCKRLCATADHFHALCANAIHLCGQEHNCQSLCQAAGVCEIQTTPQSIQSTFVGKHETFQYTKYSQVARRLPCVVPIPPGEVDHKHQPHAHGLSPDLFHFCETRCGDCNYLCTLPLGHPQREHETSHGSMSKTQWVVGEDDDDIIELQGHKFATADAGAPMLCSLFCTAQGRHTHIDFCRALSAGACMDPAVSHITAVIQPNPEREKDWVTHELHWQRLGFKDPYTAIEQADFAKCDAMCCGDEHKEAGQQPSFCILPMFHPPHPIAAPNSSAREYVSNDGHSYACSNPALLGQAFHIIFAIDTSGSMMETDRTPALGTPSTATIIAHSNNRLGAVYSALHSFWMARQAAINHSAGAVARRDAYSVLLHHGFAEATSIVNDFTRTPDQLLQELLPYEAGGSNDFEAALVLAQTMMETHWGTERAPVLIFLSDGEWTIPTTEMYDICRRAVTLGNPLSFHAVSFGMGNSPCLRRMVEIATEIESSGVQRDPLIRSAAHIPSSYTEAMSTIHLTETFLEFAESMRKPRASLMRLPVVSV